MHRYIKRSLETKLLMALDQSPVTAILGPRQCGKSTLVRHVLNEREDVVILDLELPSDLRKLDDPELFLREHAAALVCIDEVQLKPELFPLLRALVDMDRRPGRFLVLGSASQDLIRQGAETLAGRIRSLELTPFSWREVVDAQPDRFDYRMLWWRGGFPCSLLSEDEAEGFAWRHDFIQTYLSRDIPQFGFSIPAPAMFRFWQMLAHFHGGILNTSKIGQSLGISHNTVRKYIDILEQTFMVRTLNPLHVNLKKRLIKSPKVYFRDTGLLHHLLEIPDMTALYGNPVFGQSWEGWCLEQIINELPSWRSSYYRTSTGEEVDLIMEKGSRRLAFEFKASLSPRLSRGFAGTQAALCPEHTWIVCPMEEKGYALREGVSVVGIRECLNVIKNPTL